MVVMATKRLKKHKIKISDFVISVGYNEKKIEILTFYDIIKIKKLSTLILEKEP